MKHAILVLRPYGASIRQPMFAALEELGFEIGAEDIVDRDRTDEEVIEQIRDEEADVLLCPFNNLRFADGTSSNGLRLVRRIERELPQFHATPILMPVSIFSAASFRLEQGRSDASTADLDKRILTIEETELEDRQALLDRIRQHLG